MEKRLEVEADKLVCQFKKFRYGKKCDDGYRLATVYETEQLLKALRQNSASGSEARSNINVEVVKHELVPSRGEQEAFRLKDGYLFDFGTLATFYRHSYQEFESPTDWDPSEKFRISYKLGVPHDFSGFCFARMRGNQFVEGDSIRSWKICRCCSSRAH